uniref:Uncharacterized protein n=1 Tax=Arundo donax TaxID=35708 RepID=A0A0A8ZYI4_ARUDO
MGNTRFMILSHCLKMELQRVWRLKTMKRPRSTQHSPAQLSKGCSPLFLVTSRVSWSRLDLMV